MDLEEAADRLAVDAETDHAARAIDLLDRVRRDEPAPAREQARLHREGVGDVSSGAVHRARDLSHDPAPAIGDDVAPGAAEVDGGALMRSRAGWEQHQPAGDLMLVT